MDRKLEKYLIWSLIISPDSILAVSEIISEKDFIDNFFKNAFSSVLSMKRAGKEIDLPSLYLEMGRPTNISSVLEGVDDLLITDPVHYALLLKQRNLENDFQEAAKQRDFDVVKQRIKDIESLGKPASLFTIANMIEADTEKYQSFQTGYTDLDKILNFKETDLMVIAGRTSIGKSTLGISILSNIALEYPVGMISFEMSPRGVMERLAKNHSLDYLNKINSSFLVSCPSAFNLFEVRKALRDMRGNNGVKVVLVDYLQLMQESRHFQSRHLEISYIIRALKEIAKEFGIGMIVISSISRQVDARGEHSRPVLGDLKESGDREFCVESVLLLHREKSDNEAELIVAKQRYGQKGIVRLVWLPEKVAYGNWAWKERGDD